MIVGTAVFLPISDISAQKTKSSSNQQWIQYYSNIALSERWSLVSDYGLRRREHLSEWSQMLVRVGAGYQIHPSVKGVVGMAFLTFHKGGDRTKVEYRPYQELGSVQSFAKLRIQHRLRIEERFFQSTNENGDPSSFNFRFRYRLLGSYPVADMNGEREAGSFLIYFGNEILVNAGSEIIYNQFDSNRVLIGPAFQWRPNLTLSLLYNYLYAQRNQPETFTETHVLWLGIKHKLEFD
jgi:hypothetical protein